MDQNNQTVSVRTGAQGAAQESQADKELAKAKNVTIKTEDYAIASIIIENIENPKLEGVSDEEKKRMTDEKAVWESNDNAARQKLLDDKIAKAKEVAAILKQAEQQRQIPGTFGPIAIKKEQDEKKVVLSRTAAIAWGVGIGLGAALVAALVTYLVMKAKKDAAASGSDTVEV